MLRRPGARRSECEERRARVVVLRESGGAGGSPKMKNLMKAKMSRARESWPRKKAVRACIVWRRLDG